MNQKEGTPLARNRTPLRPLSLHSHLKTSTQYTINQNVINLEQRLTRQPY